MSHLVLVACCARKLPRMARAQDLYCSPWFRKARAYAEREGDRWYILSALYLAVPPTRLLPPYSLSLADLPAAARHRWASRVFLQLVQEYDLRARDRVTLLAGRSYRDGLVPLLESVDCAVHVPMAGLGIGAQLAYLTHSLEVTHA